MEWLWEPNKYYDSSKPLGRGNLPYELPYKGLDKSLTTDELPELLQEAKCLQLTALGLDGTKIDALPDSIGDLSHLEYLDLGFTSISALPDSISKLSNLKYLNLEWTHIEALPQSIGDLNSLQTLDLTGTPIRFLPETIGNLSNLQRLYWAGKFTRNLPDSISKLYKLQILDLGFCHLESIPKSVFQLGLPFFTDDKRSNIERDRNEWDVDDMNVIRIEATPRPKGINLGGGHTGRRQYSTVQEVP